MAEFEKKKHAQDEFNKGNKYVANDGVQPATINNLVENSLYTEAFAESLASTPDTTKVAQVGTPSVELVDNPSAGVTGAKKFKFSNLKGEQGHSYFRANTSLATTATSVSSSLIAWGTSTEALTSDSIVDNNGNVFAVTATTAATASTIPVAYRSSIRGKAGSDGTDGEDGDSVFIRYSASSNGANMTTAPVANTHYIGFYRGQSASNTASDYTWSQYVGKEISEIAIDEFSFVITYDDGTTSTVPLNTENCLVTYAVPSDEATAMTAFLVPNNADLNTYRGSEYWGKTFYAGGTNTVQNTPIAGIAFSLEVLRSGTFATTQRITMMAPSLNNQPTVYTRNVSDSTTTSADGTWTAWTEVAEEQGSYPSMGAGRFIGTRIAENTNLNSLVPSSSNTALHYYCDSIAAAQTFENCPVDVPFNMIAFAPQTAGGRYSQILFSILTDEMIFSRYCENNSWSAWRQYAITDGTYPEMEVGEARMLSMRANVSGAGQLGWYKVGTVTVERLKAIQNTNASYSLFMLVNGANPPGTNNSAARSGVVEIDTAVGSGGQLQLENGYTAIKILCGNIDVNDFAVGIDSAGTTLTVYMDARENGVGTRTAFSVISEVYGSMSGSAFAFGWEFYGAAPPADAVYAQVRNTASQLAEAGRYTLLWSSETPWDGSPMNVPNVEKYTQLLVECKFPSEDAPREYEKYILLNRVKILFIAGYDGTSFYISLSLAASREDNLAGAYHKDLDQTTATFWDTIIAIYGVEATKLPQSMVVEV